MTRELVDAQMGRLIVLKGWPDDIGEYYPALSDIAEDVLPDAISHALKTRTWFPTPAEVRADCDVIVRMRPLPSAQRTESQVVELLGGGREFVLTNPFGGEPLRIPITREWKYDCGDCGDTGWVSSWCGEGRGISVPCGRRLEHRPHEWVTRCDCVATNPTIRRHREAQARYSQAPARADA